MDYQILIKGGILGLAFFVAFYVGWYFWNNFGLNRAYYSLFSGKKRQQIKAEIRERGFDKLTGDAKIHAYLLNPIISNANPQIITQAEIEIEKEKPIIEVKNYIREQLANSQYPNSPIVYEQIKLTLLKQGFKESFIKGLIKQIQKESKNGTRPIWANATPRVPTNTRDDRGTNPSDAIGSNLGGFAKPGNLPVGNVETLGTAQRPLERTSPSPKGKSKYFD